MQFPPVKQKHILVMVNKPLQSYERKVAIIFIQINRKESRMRQEILLELLGAGSRGCCLMSCVVPMSYVHDCTQLDAC